MRTKLIRDNARFKALKELRNKERCNQPKQLFPSVVSVNVSSFKMPKGNKEFLDKINNPKNLSWHNLDTGETTPFIGD